MTGEEEVAAKKEAVGAEAEADPALVGLLTMDKYLRPSAHLHRLHLRNHGRLRLRLRLRPHPRLRLHPYLHLHPHLHPHPRLRSEGSMMLRRLL